MALDVRLLAFQAYQTANDVLITVSQHYPPRFFIGLITGALIGARLYAVFSPGDRSFMLAAALVTATAVVFGFLADRYRAG